MDMSDRTRAELEEALDRIGRIVRGQATDAVARQKVRELVDALGERWVQGDGVDGYAEMVARRKARAGGR